MHTYIIGCRVGGMAKPTNEELHEAARADPNQYGIFYICQKVYPVIERQVRKRVAAELRMMATFPLHRPHADSLIYAADVVEVTS